MVAADRIDGSPGPLTVDWLIYTSSMVMLDSTRRRVPMPPAARWLLGLSVTAALAANVGHGLAPGLIGAFCGNLFRPGGKDDLEVPEDEILSGLKESLRGRTLGSSRRQITQYPHDPEVQRTARGLVVAQIGPSTRVVVAHDLGSVVAYEALCDHPELNVETFITLGSPIGQPNVFDRLEPAPRNGIGSWPGSVKRWINIADQDDGIAQPKQLAPLFDGPVLDLFVSTGRRPHGAARYLAATATGRAIADGLL